MPAVSLEPDPGLLAGRRLRLAHAGQRSRVGDVALSARRVAAVVDQDQRNALAGGLLGAVENRLAVRRNDEAVWLRRHGGADELALLAVVVVAALVVHRDAEVGGSLALALLHD